MLVEECGECHFVQKNMSCGWRTASTNTDYCKADRVIGTLCHCFHILKKFATNDLQTLVTVANEDKIIEGDKIDEKDKNDKNFRIPIKRKTKRMTKEDQQTTTAAATSTCTDPMLQQIHNIIYRETQIHGHFPINVDIAELWIPKK